MFATMDFSCVSDLCDTFVSSLLHISCGVILRPLCADRRHCGWKCVVRDLGTALAHLGHRPFAQMELCGNICKTGINARSASAWLMNCQGCDEKVTKR